MYIMPILDLTLLQYLRTSSIRIYNVFSTYFEMEHEYLLLIFSWRAKVLSAQVST